MLAIHMDHPYFGDPRMKQLYGRRVSRQSLEGIATCERTGDFFGEPEKAKIPQLYSFYGVAESVAALVTCTRVTAETGVTYISDGTRFYYLSATQELFNNGIVAWQISERNNVKLVVNRLEQWTRKRDVSRAVLHSVRTSSIRLRRTTHDSKNSATRAVTFAKLPAWIMSASNPSFHISKRRSCTLTSVSHKEIFIKRWRSTFTSTTTSAYRPN